MSMKEFGSWLYSSPLSQAIQNTEWVIPTIQWVHILALSVLVGSSLVLDLRLAGLTARDESGPMIVRRHMPWIWAGLLMLVASGLVMVAGEPERVLFNWLFWTKMALVPTGMVLTLIIRGLLLRGDVALRGGADTSWTRRLLGLSVLAIWAVVILCGRWIAYIL